MSVLQSISVRSRYVTPRCGAGQINPARVQRLQQRRLARLLRLLQHHARHSPFYREKFRDMSACLDWRG